MDGCTVGATGFMDFCDPCTMHVVQLLSDNSVDEVDLNENWNTSTADGFF